MKIFVKMLLAAIVAVCMACVLIMHGASDKAVIVTLFVTGIAVSALLGVYNMPAERTKHMSLKDGARHYDQAA